MRAAEYARFSSDNQRQASIDAQLRTIREYARRAGIDIIRTYTDEAISGKTDDRAAFRRMMTDAHTGMFGLIIVHEFSRAFRNAKDSAVYRDELRAAGVRIVSVLEPVEDSPIGRFMETIIAGKDQMYSEHLAIETMKGLKENAYNATFCGGRAPLGYDIVNQKYVVNQSEAATVRLIFSMYANGCTYGAILDALDGRRTKGGSAFGKNSLHSILTNEKYVGTFTFNVRSYGKGKKRNPDEEIIRVPEAMPAIIDQETWEAVKKRMSENKMNAAGRAKHFYLLSGKVVCGKCGASYSGITNANGKGRVYAYYRCAHACGNKAVQQARLESVVLEKMCRTFFTDTDRCASDIYERQDMGAEQERKRRLREIGKEVRAIVDAIASGAYHKALNDRLSALQAEEDALYCAAQTVYTKADIKRALDAFVDLPTKTKEEQRNAVLSLVDKVTVQESGEIQITFIIPMVAGEGLEPTTSGL